MQKILLFVCLGFVLNSTAQSFDIDMLRSINAGPNTVSDNFFKTFSNSVAPLDIAVPIGIATYGFIKHDKSTLNKGLYIGSSILVAGAIGSGLKLLVNRERPFKTYSFINQKEEVEPYSFPSNHSALSFSLATSLSLAFPKWYIVLPSYLWATTVVYSRMHLGVHYPSDVLGGMIVGAGSAYLSWKINNWLQKKQQHVQRKNEQ